MSTGKYLQSRQACGAVSSVTRTRTRTRRASQQRDARHMCNLVSCALRTCNGGGTVRRSCLLQSCSATAHCADFSCACTTRQVQRCAHALERVASSGRFAASPVYLPTELTTVRRAHWQGLCIAAVTNEIDPHCGMTNVHVGWNRRLAPMRHSLEQRSVVSRAEQKQPAACHAKAVT